MEHPARIAALVRDENERLKHLLIDGFLPYNPDALARAISSVLPHLPAGARSLDMGSGTGAWWLLAASAGIASYAIELDSVLCDAAQRSKETCLREGLILPGIPCDLAHGDMIPRSWHGRYDAFKQRYAEVTKSMPRVEAPDGYALLGIPLSAFDVIYCWAWPTQSRFLFNMLAAEAKPGCILVLPSFTRYTQGEHMNNYLREPNTLVLDILEEIGEVVIGRVLGQAPS